MDYKELTKTLTKTVAAIVSSTGSYTSREIPSHTYYGEIAKEALEYEGIMHNPVILLHGFFGSTLVDTKTELNLWGDFDIKETVGTSPEKMNKLAYPMELGKPLPKVKHTVQAENLLEEVNIQFMGMPLKMPVYKDMVEILVKGGFQPEHYRMQSNKSYNTLFNFAYDWRCDLQENAKKLHAFIHEKKKYMQEQYKKHYGLKNYDVHFDIIAHSMGGLIARYFLRYGDQKLPQGDLLPNLNWEGAEHIDRLIMVGTPNAGYLDAFLELLYRSPIQPYPPTVLGSFPSYYQMLPAPETQSIIDKKTREPIDIFDSEIWIKMKWGLAKPENDEVLQHILPELKTPAARREVALDHLTKCLHRAKHFIHAMRASTETPQEVDLHLVCGNGIKTTRRAEVDPETGEVEVCEYASGDGKVLTSSALWDKRAEGEADGHFMTSPINWSNIMLLRAAHMGITKAQGFEDNLLFLLTMKESQKQQNLKS